MPEPEIAIISPSAPLSKARPWVGDVLSLGGGGLLVFAFAPFDWSVLAIVSLALLFVAINDCSRWRAAARGWLHGLAAFGGGMYWIYHSFAFVHIDALIALPLTILLVMLLAGYSALMAALYACLAPPQRSLALLGLAPALWVLIEWLRGQSQLAITWLQLGYSQLSTPLAGWLPLFGSYGASFAVALTAGLIAATTYNRALPRRMSIVVVALWLGGAALTNVDWSDNAGAALQVALLQGNILQDEKWLPDKQQQAIDRYRTLSQQHFSTADLIVWPEVAITDFFHRSQALLDELEGLAKRHETHLLVGLLVADSEQRRVFNSMYLLGAKSGFYYKYHLVPFGEYLPLKGLLQPIVDWLGIRVADLHPGPPPWSTPPSSSLMVGNLLLSVSICYEIIFGAEIARAARATQLLVSASNDAWFGDSIGPHQHLQIARARALETGRWLVRATNTGITAFVNPKGQIVAQAPQFQPAALRHAIEPRSGMTPYMRWLDWPIILLAAGVTLLIALKRLRM